MSQKEIIQYISTAEREGPLIQKPSLIKAKLRHSQMKETKKSGHQKTYPNNV